MIINRLEANAIVAALSRNRLVRLTVLAILLLQFSAPAALADCSYNSCNLPCTCWTLISANPITSCGYQCWREERVYYCNTYPFGYWYCYGCFCYA